MSSWSASETPSGRFVIVGLAVPAALGYERLGINPAPPTDQEVSDDLRRPAAFRRFRRRSFATLDQALRALRTHSSTSGHQP